MYKTLLLIFMATGLAFSAMAQGPVLNAKPTPKDSINQNADSLTKHRFAPRVKHGDDKIYHPDSTHSPHKAVMRSLMIPGWGQIYNHQWWKVPVIYAGLGLLADAILFNQRYYGPNLIVARYYEHGTPYSPNLPQAALYQQYISYNVPQQTVYNLVDSYRRDRDLSIMGFVGAWGIQMVDAYIDAKFQHSYTMDTDFSFKIEPAIINQQQTVYALYSGSYIPGVKLTMSF